MPGPTSSTTEAQLPPFQAAVPDVVGTEGGIGGSVGGGIGGSAGGGSMNVSSSMNISTAIPKPAPVTPPRAFARAGAGDFSLNVAGCGGTHGGGYRADMSGGCGDMNMHMVGSMGSGVGMAHMGGGIGMTNMGGGIGVTNMGGCSGVMHMCGKGGGADYGDRGRGVAAAWTPRVSGFMKGGGGGPHQMPTVGVVLPGTPNQTLGPRPPMLPPPSHMLGPAVMSKASAVPFKFMGAPPPGWSPY